MRRSTHEGDLFIRDFFNAAPVLATLVALILIGGPILLRVYVRSRPDAVTKAEGRGRLHALFGLILLSVGIIGCVWWLTKTDLYSRLTSHAETLRTFDPSAP